MLNQTMLVLPIFIFFCLLQQFASATSCTKSFGQYVDKNSYYCCVHLGGTPKITLKGCAYGQCRDLTCDLPEENAKKWDCYTYDTGSISGCLPFMELMKTCTKDEINNGFKCPATELPKYM